VSSLSQGNLYAPLRSVLKRRIRGALSNSVSPVHSESSALRGTRHWSPGLCQHSIYTTGFQCLRFHNAIAENNYAAHWKDGKGGELFICHSSAERVFERRHWSPGLCKHSIYFLDARVPLCGSEGIFVDARVPQRDLGGIKLDFRVPRFDFRGIKLDFRVPSHTSEGTKTDLEVE
jgi:hypothetical protein